MKLSQFIDSLIPAIRTTRDRRPGNQIEQPDRSWIKWTNGSDAQTLLTKLSYKEVARLSIPVIGTDGNDLSIDDSLFGSVRQALLEGALSAPKDRPLGLAFMPDPIWHSPLTVSLVVFGPDK
jgi:hypothetical protein